MSLNHISLQKLGMVPKITFRYHIYTNSWSSSMAKIHFMYIVGLPRRLRFMFFVLSLAVSREATSRDMKI